MSLVPPILCPGCGAVLGLWQDGERQQTCSHGGHTVSLTGQPAAPAVTPPVLCPRCGAVLGLWRDGERQQTCSHCGHTISLP
jgi:hypothetical protein